MSPSQCAPSGLCCKEGTRNKNQLSYSLEERALPHTSLTGWAGDSREPAKEGAAGRNWVLFPRYPGQRHEKHHSQAVQPPQTSALVAGARLGLGFVIPFQDHGPYLTAYPERRFSVMKMGEHWPPNGVAGGLGREIQLEVARDAWDSWSEGGPHTEAPPFSFFLLLLSCGFHGILSPGSGSEYNPGLAHPHCLLFPCQHQCGVERSVGETGKGSRVSSVGRLWAVPGWAPEVAVETIVVQTSGPILVPAVEP